MDVKQLLHATTELDSVEALRQQMQSVIQNLGFESFTFVDTGDRVSRVPFYLGTASDAWQTAYKDNDFVAVDPYIHMARRSNLPFVWGTLPKIASRGGRVAGAGRLFDAVRDFGYTDGLVIPLHFRDPLGRPASGLVSFIWTRTPREYAKMLQEHRIDLHIFAYYWTQRLIDVHAGEQRDKSPITSFRLSGDAKLTDREREVLQHSAWGKTSKDIAALLEIAESTVDQHFKTIASKLSAATRTHAVSLAISARLIDPPAIIYGEILRD